MSDYLVDLGANKRARNVIKKLGLPLPLPQKLRRGDGRAAPGECWTLIRSLSRLCFSVGLTISS